MNWEKRHFERILCNIIAITFGKYMILHQLDVKNHVSDQLCKQNFSILRTYFDNYLKNALFGIFGSKVGILSTKISKKERTTPNMGLFLKEIASWFVIFWVFWVFLGFGLFWAILGCFEGHFGPFWASYVPSTLENIWYYIM